MKWGEEWGYSSLSLLMAQCIADAMDNKIGNETRREQQPACFDS